MRIGQVKDRAGAAVGSHSLCLSHSQFQRRMIRAAAWGMEFAPAAARAQPRAASSAPGWASAHESTLWSGTLSTPTSLKGGPITPCSGAWDPELRAADMKWMVSTSQLGVKWNKHLAWTFRTQNKYFVYLQFMELRSLNIYRSFNLYKEVHGGGIELQSKPWILWSNLGP